MGSSSCREGIELSSEEGLRLLDSAGFEEVSAGFELELDEATEDVPSLERDSDELVSEDDETLGAPQEARSAPQSKVRVKWFFITIS